MSDYTKDTLIIIEKIRPSIIVEKINNILNDFGFLIDISQDSYFHLHELEVDDYLEENYDTPRQVEDPLKDLELLKSHPGGAITYENDNTNEVLTCFKSIDDETINGILFYPNVYFFEKDKKMFNDIFKRIIEEIDVLGIIQGDNLFDKLDEETEIKNTIKGNINKEYEYKAL